MHVAQLGNMSRTLQPDAKGTCIQKSATSEESSEDYTPFINEVFAQKIKDIQDIYGKDLSYMSWYAPGHAVMNDGTPAEGISQDEWGGSHTKKKKIAITLQPERVLRHYGLHEDPKDFLRAIIGHELLHELQHRKHLTKAQQRKIVEKAEAENFSTPYLEQGLVSPEHKFKETMVEYMNEALINRDKLRAVQTSGVTYNKPMYKEKLEEVLVRRYGMEKSAAALLTAVALGSGVGGLQSHMKGENAWDGVYRGVNVGGGMYGGGVIGGLGGGVLGGVLGDLIGKRLGNKRLGQTWGAGIGGAAGLLGGMAYGGKKAGEYADKKLAKRDRIESLKVKLHDALQKAYPEAKTITMQAVSPNGASVKGTQQPAKGSLKEIYEILRKLKKEKTFNVLHARRTVDGGWETQYEHDRALQKAYEEAIKQD